MRGVTFALVLLVISSRAAQGAVAKRVLSSETRAKTVCLSNGQLEAVAEGAFTGWREYGVGYEVDAAVARSGRHSARCGNALASEQRGLSAHLELNQAAPRAIVAECWSKAEGVSPGAPQDYSLYLDLEYADGTPLWGRIGAFDAGRHDWQRQTVTIVPEKPVRSLTVYGLLRNRTGTAWFDDFGLWEIAAQTAEFDGVVVEARPRQGDRLMMEPELKTEDGFRLGFLGPGNKSAGHFMIRDVATTSDFLRPEGKLAAKPDGSVALAAEEETLRVGLDVTYRSVGKAIRIDGIVRDLTGKDRALTVYFTYPIDAVGWNWYDDQATARRIEAGGKYHNLVENDIGANGLVSRYPLACLASETEAVAIAVPLDMPRLCRLGYDAASGECYAAFDLGLAPDTENFPSQATFSFVLYRSEAKWGFRSALARYYELFPHCFTKRNQKEGIWMPFTDISTVEGWEDFGFQFKEGDNNVAFDAAHGIYSFFYVEPWSNWVDLPPETERTPEQVLALLEKRAAEGSEKDQATLSSLMQRTDGSWCIRMEKQPWCDGAVMGVNPSPGLPQQPGRPTQYQDLWRRIDAAFARSPQLTGVYHDSFEMYMFANAIDHRREHFRKTTLPLVFDREGRVGQYVMFSMVEFAREVAARMWARGGMTFANGTPHRFPWGAPWLDVMGTEAPWASEWGKSGEYRGESASDLNYWRAVCYQRPYLMLLNTRFELWQPEWFQRYMQRCTAWGVFPSMFSHNASEDPYWRSPDLYNRDRHLFRRYLPVIRALSAAGWEPVTLAVSSNSQVYVERFGRPGGTLYLTVYNDSEARQSVEIGLDAQVTVPKLTEVLSGEEVSVKDRAVRLEIGPQEVKVLCAR